MPWRLYYTLYEGILFGVVSILSEQLVGDILYKVAIKKKILENVLFADSVIYTLPLFCLQNAMS